MTKKRFLTFCAAAAIAAGALATSAFGLVGGTPDSTHTYVGALVTHEGELCSGTLVSPTVFITAAHCIPADGELVALSFDQAWNGPTAFGVGFRDPAWVASQGGLSHSDLNDVGVVEIVSGPLDGPYASLPSRVGYDDSLPNNQAVTNVGYGVQDAKAQAGAGVRQSVTEKIIPGGGATGANFLKISGGNTCFGDSGGPNLVGDTIVAINSYGPSASCNAVSYSQRLDTPQVAGFIAHFLG
jgi:hypothetical protein